MKMFGKINLKAMAVALEQVAGAFSGGPLGGKFVELRIEDQEKEKVAQLRGVGNQMDILSDKVRIESSHVGTFIFSWPDFETALKWPKSKNTQDLDWKIELKKGTETHILTISRGRASLETETVVETMPALETLVPHTTMVVDANKFAGGLKKAASMAGREDVRYYLNGVYLTVDKADGEGPGSIIAVGTDGHRLAKVEMEAKQIDGEASSVIVPNAGVQQLEMFMLRYASDVVAIGFSNSHIIMKGVNGYRLRCQLIDGRYPDYNRVIPNLADAKVVSVDKDEMTFGLGIAGKAAGLDVKPLVELGFEVGSLAMKGHYRVGTSATIRKSEFQTDSSGFEGTPFSSYLNIKYVSDVLSQIQGSDVQLYVYDPSRAVVIVEGSVLFVIMPTKP